MMMRIFLAENRTWLTINNVSIPPTPAAFSSVVKCLRMSTRCSLKGELRSAVETTLKTLGPAHIHR